MKVTDTIYNRDTLRRKAKLARRRSHLAWPDNVLDVATHVRIEARVALVGSIREYWRRYRRSNNAEDRARYRSYLRAKITAFRCLSI